PAEAFVLQLVGAAGDGLHRIYVHCQAYPGRAGLLDYLQESVVGTAALYVNTVGRSVLQVRQEAQLHDAIQSYGDDNAARFRNPDPLRVRASIQEFVECQPALAWARQPPPSADTAYVLGETVQFALVGAAGMVLFPWILLAAPAYLAIL